MDSSFDSLVQELAAVIEEGENRPAMVSSVKYKQMEFVEACMRYLTKGTNATVTTEVNTPFKSMGSVTVEAESLAFLEPIWFARAAEFASNAEIYPLVENRVRLQFAFYGLLIPV